VTRLINATNFALIW